MPNNVIYKRVKQQITHTINLSYKTKHSLEKRGGAY